MSKIPRDWETLIKKCASLRFYFIIKGAETRVLSHIKISSISSPEFSIEIVNCSNSLFCKTEGTSKVRASFAGSRLASPLKSTPHWPVSELKIIVQVCSPGIVHKLYFPAFRVCSPNNQILIGLKNSGFISTCSPHFSVGL
jgi:hypothetical protein